MGAEGKDIALDVRHISIDYRTFDNTSVMQLFRKKKGKKDAAGTFRAVNDVSFYVEKSKILGIVGSNGAGKTTLLRSVAGIFHPDEGMIDTKGNRVSLMAIGVGFNNLNTGRENIFKSGMLLGCSKKYIEQYLDQIIEFSELGKFIDRPVRTYSSGMYSKLSFAITAILDADILLVDEVLSVGDEHFRKKSYQKMEELILSDHTVLIVSHDIETLRKFCDDVLWLEHGNMIKIGPTAEILDEYKAFMSD